MKKLTKAEFAALVGYVTAMQHGKTTSPSKMSFNEIALDIKNSRFVGEDAFSLESEGYQSILSLKSGFRCSCNQFQQSINSSRPFCYHTFIHSLKLFNQIGLEKMSTIPVLERDFLRFYFDDMGEMYINPENFDRRTLINYVIVGKLMIFFTETRIRDGQVSPMATFEVNHDGFIIHCNCGEEHYESELCYHAETCMEYIFSSKLNTFFESNLALNRNLSLKIKERYGLTVNENNMKDFAVKITPDGLDVTANIDGLVDENDIIDLINDEENIIISKKKQNLKMENKIDWEFLLQLEENKRMVLSVSEVDSSGGFVKQTSPHFVPEIDLVVQSLMSQFNDNQSDAIEKFSVLRNLTQRKGSLLINPQGRISKKNVLSRKIQKGDYNIGLRLTQDDDFYILNMEVDSDFVVARSVKVYQKSILDTGEYLVFPNSQADLDLIKFFSADGRCLIPKSVFDEHGIRLIIKFLEGYKVRTDDPDLSVQITQGNVEFKVDLQPFGKDYITVNPQVFLNGEPIKDPSKMAVVSRNKEKVHIEVIPANLVNEFNSLLEKTLKTRKSSESESGVFHLDKISAFHDLWLGEMVQVIKSRGYQVSGMQNFKNIEFSEQAAVVKRDLFEEIDWFGVKVNIYYGNNKVSIDKILEAITNGKRTVALSDGTLGVISEDLIEEVLSLTQRAEKVSSGVYRVAKSNILFVEELAAKSDSKKILKEIREKIEALQNYANTKPAPLPKTIKAELRHYQSEGFQYLQTMEAYGLGAVLGDEMGLGKTLQSIVTIEHLKAKYKKEFQGGLIICPVTLISNWESEFNTFCPKTSVVKYYGKDRATVKLPFRKGDIVITSNQTFRSDQKVFMEKEWQVVIVDEAQNIKNPEAKTTLAVNELKSKWRLALTGTPVENKALDAFSIFSFTNPGILGTIGGFKKYYDTPINKGDSDKAASLNRILSHFMIRRTKAKVLTDLPPKTESVIYCTMDTLQREYYEAYRISIVDEVEKMRSSGTGSFAVGTRIITGIQALRQICNHPMLAPTKMEGVEKIPSVKIKVLLDQLSELIPDHKSLIFSSFQKNLDIVKAELNNAGISNVSLDGSMTKSQRDKSLKDFKDTNKAISAFLITLKAGGVGLNLTEADYVFILDPWWNPAAESQAIDRAHRIGQTNPVTALKYICKDTVEDKILQLQRKKRHIFDQIMSEGDNEELRKKIDMADLEMILLK